MAPNSVYSARDYYSLMTDRQADRQTDRQTHFGWGRFVTCKLVASLAVCNENFVQNNF